MSVTLIVVILLVVLLLGGGVGWHRGGGPGWGIGGGLGTVLLVLLILWLAGAFPR